MIFRARNQVAFEPEVSCAAGRRLGSMHWCGPDEAGASRPTAGPSRSMSRSAQLRREEESR